MCACCLFVLENHALQEGCLISWQPDPAFSHEEGLLKATDPMGREVDYPSSFAPGWSLIDIRWYNYWSKNLASIRTVRTMTDILRQQMLIVRALAIDLTVIAFRAPKTEKHSPLWPVHDALKKLERAAMQFEGMNYAPQKIEVSFVVGYKNRCTDFLTDAEFQRKVALMVREDKARTKMKELAIYAGKGSGNRNRPVTTTSTGSFQNSWKKGGGGGKGKPGGKKGDKKNIQCHKCGGFGHFARECRSKKKAVEEPKS